MHDFKRLEIWRRRRALAIALHALTVNFRRAGHAKLRAQLTDAVDSISTNIAEGCGSSTKRELARFLDISIKSATETEHHLIVAGDFGLISRKDWRRYSAETIEIRKMIFGYRRQVLENDR